MSKNKKNSDGSQFYEFLANNSREMYEAELRREESIIRQSSNMQSSIAFVSAALFVIAQIAVEYKGKISFGYLMLVFLSIILFLLLSLVFATVAQYRWKSDGYPMITDFKKTVFENYDSMCNEKSRLNYLVEQYEIFQNSLNEVNNKRSKFVRISMLMFFISIFLCAVWFLITLIAI